jgi:hypothetical protein
MTYSTFQLAILTIGNIALVLAVLLLVRGVVRKVRFGSSEPWASTRRGLLGAGGLAIMGVLAHLVVDTPKGVARAGAVKATRCALNGKEFICEGFSSLALPALPGWEFSHEPQAHKIRAVSRSDGGPVALDVSSFTNEAPEAKTLLTEVAGAALAANQFRCAELREVAVGKGEGQSMDCETGHGPTRMVAVRREPNFFTLFQCTGSNPSACEGLIAGVRWF